MDRLKNIVVGSDFSSHSENAVAQAMRIADWNGAKLHLIHVVEGVAVHDWAEAYGVSEATVWDDLRDTAQKRADEVISAARKLNAQAAQKTPAKLELDVEVIVANPFAALLGRVRDVSAELLVLGSNGFSDPARGPGTLATKCVRKIPTKVMLVHGFTPGPFQRVVACVDFSDTSRLVVEQALRIADQDRARVDVLHACQPPPAALRDALIRRQAVPDSQPPYRDQRESRLKGLLQAFEPGSRGLAVEFHLVAGPDEKQELVNYVSTARADLVIIGTRGRTGVKSVLIGTTAERIVRDAPCSVLAIKPEGFRYDPD
jgi:nucleotide-binding universal stress UspA family protein